MDHAVFIWSSYAVAIAAFGALVLVSLVQHRKARREIVGRGLDKPREQRAGQ
jgi:heme exporter protein CcmD